MIREAAARSTGCRRAALLALPLLQSTRPLLCASIDFAKTGVNTPQCTLSSVGWQQWATPSPRLYRYAIV